MFLSAFKRFSLTLILLCTTLLSPLSAVMGNEPTPATAIEPSTQEAVDYPGLEEVVPRATELNNDVVAAEQKVLILREQNEFSKTADELRNEWRRERDLLENYGEVSEWPVNRLLNVRSSLERIGENVVQLLDRIAVPLKTLEETRKKWNETQQYWRQWQQTLRESGAKVPRETFTDVKSKVAEVLGKTTRATDTLLKLQESVSDINQQIVSYRERISTELASVQESPFRRNAYPLFSSDYVTQFQHLLFLKASNGIMETLQLRGEFFKRQLWLLIVQSCVLLSLLVFLLHLRKTAEEKTDDLHFVFARPFAAALFVTLVTTYFFLVNPPQLVLLGMLVAATIAASRLACALLPEGNQRTLTYTLAGIFILNKVLSTSALPQPLYRLYLCGLTVLGIPFIYSILRRHRKHQEQAIDRYALILYGGISILGISFLAQAGGYATFSQSLINASIDSIFIMLFTLMAMRIAEGGIELSLQSQLIASRRFVKNLGNRVIARLNRLCRIFISILAVLYLLEVWGVFADISSAWEHLMGLDYAIGEFHISVKMVVLVIAVLYLSILLSWFFQAFLESQVFFGKRIDRGVRDAFKKLSHYAFILVGFIAAMTMAGIELQNFAILAGAFGIGIGFGLQDIVNNFVSGLILLFERPVKVGDAVIIDGQWGSINKIGMRSTVVETWDHSEIIVPNSHMISEKVLNWTLSSNVSRITIPVGVRYGTDLQKVIDILNKVGDGHPAVVENPAPSAIFTEFGDNSINFELRVWVDDIKHRLSVISELGLNIDRAFKKANIEIPFPQRDLHLRSVAPELNLGPVKGSKS